MRAVIFGTAALALCLVGSFGVLQAADTPSVTIAVLRGDGVLIPIVTRSGDKWAHTWPVPAKSAEVPMGLDGIPKRWWGKPGATPAWHAWQIDGTKAEVVVERPTWYLAHCQQGVGLKTPLTARPPLPPPTRQPYPKLGMASTAPLTFLRIQAVDQSDRMWMAVNDQVEKALADAEDKMGEPSTNRMLSRHPTPTAERARTPTRVESLYRLPIDDGGRVLYYVEATKRYGMPPLPANRRAAAATPRGGCSTMTFGSGFFVIQADGVVPTPKLDVRVSSCDYDGLSLMLPLAAVGDVKGAPVWIGQVTGWDYEAYGGFRWNAAEDKIDDVFFTLGGSCVDRDGN
ncbi:MAG: hypothetical protein ABIT71_18580 [Vicinamibacteraceae bacterium]